MKFIYSDALDYIDPGYDFILDRNSPNRHKYWDDVFAHEYLERVPYDGILVSRAVVGDHKLPGKYTEAEAMRFRREGARAFLRYPEDRFPGSIVLGDCGAFQYAKMPEPPYTPEDMIEFYADGGFTHGCSVDHIIFEFDPDLDREGIFGHWVPEAMKRRYEITLDLADRFIRLSKSLGRSFVPLGVVQGWSPMSMAMAAKSLVNMGYTYIAVGGLVPLRVRDIHLILKAIREKIPSNIQIHLLGFAKADSLREFQQYNISSVDTSSPMIRAFKDDRQNYYSFVSEQDLGYFMAIRIPQALENNTLKKKIKTGKVSENDLLKSESRALMSIRGYADGKVDMDEAIEAIRDYSAFLYWNDKKTETQNNHFLDKLCYSYRKTLSVRPWDGCGCRVCKESGVEVIIFRSSNRNKRRGIHNLHVFYELIERIRKTNGS